jgi:hypothetical protein
LHINRLKKINIEECKKTDNNVFKGIEIFKKFSILSDKQRWDIYDESLLDFEPTKIDIEIIKALNYIGTGELVGIGMRNVLGHMDQIKEIPMTLMYANIIVHEEVRHGIILKMLYEKFINNKDFNKEVSYCDLMDWMIIPKSIWDNQYEFMASMYIGEIMNAKTYTYFKKLPGISKNMKKIIKNIEKDEKRHLAFWHEHYKELVHNCKNFREKYIVALRNQIGIHHAELHNDYYKGAEEIKKHTSFMLIRDIVDDMYKLINNQLGGDEVFSKTELLNIYMNNTNVR